MTTYIDKTKEQKEKREINFEELEKAIYGIEGFMFWEKTDEGCEYWEKVYSKLEKYRHEAKPNTEEKKTEFVYFITDDKTKEAIFEPYEFDYVELVRRKDDYSKYDLLIAYNKGMKEIEEFRYLGHAGGEFE